MSKLDELIKELCPDGVVYKKLGDLIKIEKGKQLNKTHLFDKYEENLYPVINGGISPSGFWNGYNYSENLITISQGGASAGYVNYIKTKFWAGAHCYIVASVNDDIIYRYIYHFLKSKEIELKNSQVGAGIPSVSLKDINSLRFPVPPLEVQCEIVRILDAFSLDSEELITELSKELEYRQKQYEYYRNDLIKETNKVEYKDLTLEDILKIKNGKDYKHLREGKYPVYGTGGIISYVNDFMYNKPSILIPRKGSLEKLYYVEEPFWNVDTIFYTEIDENEAIPKYIYYYLQNEHLEKLNIAGGIPSLTKSVLNKVKIILPSKKVQKRIVEVLDNFERICSNFNIVLPAEIEERQKQYEYYRNLLLTFREQGERIFNQASKQA